uniref:DUF4939 domain-containing protein n=1 Tax=Kryptolebias marmoratus TaxID=37003 RepID=A0A3Q3AX25_KRYMA
MFGYKRGRQKGAEARGRVRPDHVTSGREPNIRPSELFKGNTDHCKGFLLQCRLAFVYSSSLFPSNAARITYLVSALKGRALQWAQAFLSSHSLETLTLSVAAFFVDFHIVAEEAGWDELALSDKAKLDRIQNKYTMTKF